MIENVGNDPIFRFHSSLRIRLGKWVARRVLTLVSHEPKAVNPMNDTASRKVNDDIDGDTLHEECGVFGILGHSDAAALTALGLHALQHRGQEAAGIVTFDDKSKQ